MPPRLRWCAVVRLCRSRCEIFRSQRGLPVALEMSSALSFAKFASWKCPSAVTLRAVFDYPNADLPQRRYWSSVGKVNKRPILNTWTSILRTIRQQTAFPRLISREFRAFELRVFGVPRSKAKIHRGQWPRNGHLTDDFLPRCATFAVFGEGLWITLEQAFESAC
jgi:hypothetical protein